MTPAETLVQPRQKQVPAWDLPTRLFHWSLVALVLGAYVTGKYAESLDDNFLFIHRCNGLAILTLLVFRLIWGFAGSLTARFSNFITWPWRALAYAGDLLRGRAPAFLGHNPLGAWMVVALLLVVAAQAFLGLFSSDDLGLAAGPLHGLISSHNVATMTRWHHRLFNGVLLPLIAIHVLANLAYMLIKREPLIKAMVTGAKPALPYADAAANLPASHVGLRALACLAAAAALVLGTIWLLSGKLV